MNKAGIQKIIKNNPELNGKLFARGFLFSNANIDQDQYPFYGIWKCKYIRDYSLLVSPEQHFYLVNINNVDLLLIGHAYNPFSMVKDENDILAELGETFSSENISKSDSSFWALINELTGVFTIIICYEKSVFVIGDASGMQNTFYTRDTDQVFISTHTNLIGDLLNLKWDPYIKRLTRYRFFNLLGNSLPGDLTQFKDVKRLIPNHYLIIRPDGKVKEIRFYWPKRQMLSEDKISEQVAGLLHKNMILISEKWERPAISLTGGCDSKTTLACTNGVYDRFSYFSYISSEAEKVDTDAAKHICDAINVKHKTYIIPDHNEDVSKYTEIAEIINWNTGNIRYSHPNDVRKRIFFAERNDFDVEVKSWASEIGRAYYSKRFHGRKNFGNGPSGRKCTTLYKFFLHNRKLVHQTDYIFDLYLKKYFQSSKTDAIEWQEQFFWEFRVPSWNGLVITGEHRYSFDITIPYNNRRILELLLSASIETRISDKIYQDVRKKMNPEIDQTGIAVTNLKHTKARERAEDIYYSLHSKVIF